MTRQHGYVHQLFDRAGRRATALAILFLGCCASAGLSIAADRPNLTNTRLSTPFGANGHTSSIDGRLFVGNVYEDSSSMTTRWQVRVFRPEAVAYSDDGSPQFADAFSSGQTLEVHNGENALAMCFSDPTTPYTRSGGQAVYQPQVFDSQMFGSGDNMYRFRRRSLTAVVSDPFTAAAEVASVSSGSLELLTTVSGGSILGIEPTITRDGRLLIYQGSPQNDGTIDHLMYTYNPTPCAASGWSVPRALSTMNTDPNLDLQRYPLAWQPLRAPDGTLYGSTSDLIHGAYPWVDHEGRNVVFMTVPYTDGARREAAGLLGADTGWTLYHIDGGINAVRYGYPRLFFSGPMWNFEQERSETVTSPAGSSNDAHYLPVTKNHDVLGLFGSNTADYNEIDVGDLSDPFHLLSLPMNELVTLAGEYDLTRTPDLSGHHFTGTLVGTAALSSSNDLTASSSGSLWETHARGRALVLEGGGAVRVNIPPVDVPGVRSAVEGFTVQLAIRPDTDVNDGCSSDTYRYLLYRKGVLQVGYEGDGSVSMGLRIGRRWVDLGRSAPLPVGQWSHLAISWDGVTGAFREYVNGAPTGREIPPQTGTFRLGPGPVYVGADDAVDAARCPSSHGSFRGAIDEVRLFQHARSARSICLTTLGTDCLEEAIQEDPTDGQLVLSHQQPACTDSEALGAMACASALHRDCAQRGAMDALASATNLWDTVVQLVSSRPPVSLAGLPVAVDGNTVTAACIPLENDSRALEFSTLAGFHAGCSDDTRVMSLDCAAASHRWCNTLGWTTGTIFELTSRPWIACFDSSLETDVSLSSLGSGCQTDLASSQCRLEVGAWCRGQGHGGGLLQEQPSSTVATVHCFDGSTTVAWPFE